MDIVERLRLRIHTSEDVTHFNQAADEIDRLRKENQRQREHIMLLYSMIQTEHNIIRAVELKEGE